MSQNNSPVAGITYPIKTSMLGSTPMQSAAIAGANSNQQKVNLSNAVGGSKKKHVGGQSASGNVTVPQFKMPYPVTNAPSQSPNAVIQTGAAVSSQSVANAQYDSLALSGGKRNRRRSKKGGNRNWSWGCYSGGKTLKRLRRNSRKNRISKKNRKSRKSRRQ